MKNKSLQFTTSVALGLLNLTMLTSTAQANIDKKIPSFLPTQKTIPVLSDSKLLEAVGIKPLAKNASTGVGYALISAADEIKISQKAHEWSRCGGYEVLQHNPQSLSIQNILDDLQAQNERLNGSRQTKLARSLKIDRRENIVQAVSNLSDQNIASFVSWFSSFPNRFNKGATANQAPEALKVKIDTLLSSASSLDPSVNTWAQAELIVHNSTPQRSVRLTLTGKKYPNQIVVLGGHLDSISGFFGTGKAPGADDNASGSGSVFEVARVLLGQGQPERTIQLFWYAGEESGLLGSAEIAQAYKRERKDVVGVMQLDMTAFAGSGEGVIASMTDFTSVWMRSLISEINTHYVGGKIVEDQCGYGCSDHASWHRQGYPAVMPFEAKMDAMNRTIHTANDTIQNANRGDFRHALMFAKLGLGYVMHLANSDLRQP
jgi:leucyl aminopeptidase